MNDDTETLIAGLRELADFLEDNDEIAERLAASTVNFNVYAFNRDEFQSFVRQIGRGKKSAGDNFFGVIRTFGAVTLEVFTHRAQVCERVVVGTREVPETVTPARVEEIVEWRCEPILGERDGSISVAA
jgi:hypothetical protein